MPLAQYPEVTPPTVVVTASYPGANPQFVAETVATSIEPQVNGVENTPPTGTHDQLYTNNYAFLQLRDSLARLQGVGDLQVFGPRESALRIWLDPDQAASRSLTATAVVNAVREQNLQVAAGVIGQPPIPANSVDFQLTVNAQGRLTTPRVFEEIVLKSSAHGEITRLRDIGRVELAARHYSVSSNLSGKSATALVVFQNPGSNALGVTKSIQAEMERLKQPFTRPLNFLLGWLFRSFNKAFDWTNGR